MCTEGVYLIKMCFLSLLLDVWASEYVYLTAFRDWAQRKIFIPVEGVRVSVLESEPGPLLLPSNQCQACKTKWDEAGLVDRLDNINWRDPTGVVCLLTLGAHARGLL